MFLTARSVFATQAAAQWAEEKFKGRPFVSAHIRPYPDDCLEVRYL